MVFVKLVRRVREVLAADRAESREREEVFTRIFRENAWGGDESRSGPGSSRVETAGLEATLPTLLCELNAKSLLDIPCGDFVWMANVDLEGIDYVGADIVPELIEANRSWERPGRRFVKADLTRDRLPRCDVVVVRDCLVHLSLRDVDRALVNLVRSGSRYLLTTSFAANRENRDIATGSWRPLNFELPPFLFAPPLRRLAESPRETEFRDKSLALWRLSDVRRWVHAGWRWGAWLGRYRDRRRQGAASERGDLP